MPPRTATRWDLPDLGCGIGLRTPHYRQAMREPVDVGFFEIISENFMRTEGRALEVLDQVAERHPIVMHGVSLSIGSTDPIDRAYVAELGRLAARCRAVWLGDHVCWTGVAGRNTHELLPIPCTEEALAHVVERVRMVQDLLGRPLVLENPSTYVGFRAATMGEAEFLARLAEDADCGILLDVNNVYVSSRNHDLDPLDFLAAMPWDRVVQIHLAGHRDHGTHCIDTHDGPVIATVWELFRVAQERSGGRSTLVEWDEKIPPLERLVAEAGRAARERAAIGAAS